MGTRSATPYDCGTAVMRPSPRVHAMAADEARTVCGRRITDYWHAEVDQPTFECWQANRPERICDRCRVKVDAGAPVALYDAEAAASRA